MDRVCEMERGKIFEKLFGYGDANVQLLQEFYHLCEVNLWERARRV